MWLRTFEKPIVGNPLWPAGHLPLKGGDYPAVLAALILQG
jgi:hypothetical protein